MVKLFKPKSDFLSKYIKWYSVFEKDYNLQINFTPLGINYFFDDYYNKIAPENFQNIRSRSWIDFLPELFSISNSIEQIKLLENFLINQFRKLNLEKLQHAIDLFMEYKHNYKISEVADIIGINEKTMRRMFNKYIGCSPVAFKRIARFRNAINIKMNDKSYNLTQIGHESFFYDSSHFGRECKKIAGENLKTFFNNVSFLGNKGYPCIFT